MSLMAIILAAGREARMKSKRPWALHEICGRPMLHYVLQAAYGAGCARAVVVVGTGKDEVVAAFDEDERIAWIDQPEPLGAGDALRACQKQLKKHGGEVLVLPGNTPLVQAEVLRTLLNAHRDERAAASVATAVVDDPAGCPRVERDENGAFVRLVEDADDAEDAEEASAGDEQPSRREVSCGYYCFRADDLLTSLAKWKAGGKGGRRLSDVLSAMREAGKRILAVQVVPAADVARVDTRAQLADADAMMEERIHRRLRDGGVTIVSSPATYVEDGVMAGQDTVIHPFTFIGRDSSIGPSCVIGPFASLPRQSIVPEGVTIAGNISVETATLTPPG